MNIGLPENGKNSLFETKCQYLQEQDTCSDKDDMNELFIETCDGGGGVYYVIRTDRFTFDSIEEIVELFNDFIKRSK